MLACPVPRSATNNTATHYLTGWAEPAAGVCACVGEGLFSSALDEVALKDGVAEGACFFSVEFFMMCALKNQNLENWMTIWIKDGPYLCT